jgi:F-type H+-transporting ATPase subunit delta
LPAATDRGSGLAGRYATALFELAREQDALDDVARDLDALAGLIAESEDFRRLVRSPVISRDDQGRALAAIAAHAGLNTLTGRFLGLLAHKRRLFTLEGVAATFRRLLAQHRGEVAAEVASAVPLTGGQLKKVEEAVAGHLGRRVTLSARVDPRLLGGLVVRVGSRMIDASLRTQLQHLELAMRGAG